jgi:serine/threonine protein kinase
MYMSPELIINNEYEFEVDIWSMGVITYILLSGDSPFHGDDK